jgi:hypothetical protein
MKNKTYDVFVKKHDLEIIYYTMQPLLFEKTVIWAQGYTGSGLYMSSRPYLVNQAVKPIGNCVGFTPSQACRLSFILI